MKQSDHLFVYGTLMSGIENAINFQVVEYGEFIGLGIFPLLGAQTPRVNLFFAENRLTLISRTPTRFLGLTWRQEPSDPK